MVGKRRTDRPRHAALLKDEDIRRWHQNVSQGSPLTADVRLREMNNFCIRTDTTPKALLKMDEKKLHSLMLDFIAAEQKRGKSGSYIYNIVGKSVKSWLAFNGVEVKRPIKVKGASEVKLQEAVPTQEELRQVLLAGDNRARTMCVLMAHAGVRPEVLGTYHGEDGLQIQDLPDLAIRGEQVEFTKIPAMVVVRQALSKAGHRYFTFLGEEGCGYVKAYLEERIRAGEKLVPESPLCSPRWQRHEKDPDHSRFYWTTNLGSRIREAIRKAGFSWRPYVLRAYFDTQLLLAESKGKVTRDYRVFWMGHVGDIEHRYTVNKTRLPASMVEDMRRAYKAALPFLETVPQGKSESGESKLVKFMMLDKGYSPEEIEELRFDEMSFEEGYALWKKVKDKSLQTDGGTAVVLPAPPVHQAPEATRTAGPPVPTATPTAPPEELPRSAMVQRGRQKVISPDEFQALFDQGWEYRTELPDGRWLVQFVGFTGT